MSQIDQLAHEQKEGRLTITIETTTQDLAVELMAVANSPYSDQPQFVISGVIEFLVRYKLLNIDGLGVTKAWCDEFEK